MAAAGATMCPTSATSSFTMARSNTGVVELASAQLPTLHSGATMNSESRAFQAPAGILTAGPDFLSSILSEGCTLPVGSSFVPSGEMSRYQSLQGGLSSVLNADTGHISTTAVEQLRQQLMCEQQQGIGGRPIEVDNLEKVGQGSFGVVYRGVWQGANVAIKYLVSSSTQQLQISATEALLSKLLAHPNVVQTFACKVVELTPEFFASPSTQNSSGAFATAAQQRLTAACATCRGVGCAGCDQDHDLAGDCGVGARDLGADHPGGTRSRVLNGPNTAGARRRSSQAAAGGGAAAAAASGVALVAASGLHPSSGAGGSGHSQKTTQGLMQDAASTCSTDVPMLVPRGTAAIALDMEPDAAAVGDQQSQPLLLVPHAQRAQHMNGLRSQSTSTALMRHPAEPPLLDGLSCKPLHSSTGATGPRNLADNSTSLLQHHFPYHRHSPVLGVTLDGMVPPVPASQGRPEGNVEAAVAAGGEGGGAASKAAEASDERLGLELMESFQSGDGFGAPYLGDEGAVRPSPYTRSKYHALLVQIRAKPRDFLTQIIMEHCDRGSLQRAIDKSIFRASARWNSRVALRAMLRTAREIAQGMCHLHASQIVHGDLKPANVLLKSSRSDRRGFIAKVADFGLSKIVQVSERGALECDTDATGTIAYMAPEVLNGSLCPAADIYSFGVMLWQLVTGERPFADVHPGRMYVGVCSGSLRLEWPADAHPMVRKLGDACLSYDKRQRPSFTKVARVLGVIETVVRNEGAAQAAAAAMSAAVPAPLSSLLRGMGSGARGGGGTSNEVQPQMGFGAAGDSLTGGLSLGPGSSAAHQQIGLPAAALPPQRLLSQGLQYQQQLGKARTHSPPRSTLPLTDGGGDGGGSHGGSGHYRLGAGTGGAGGAPTLTTPTAGRLLGSPSGSSIQGGAFESGSSLLAPTPRHATVAGSPAPGLLPGFRSGGGFAGASPGSNGGLMLVGGGSGSGLATGRLLASGSQPWTQAPALVGGTDPTALQNHPYPPQHHQQQQVAMSSSQPQPLQLQFQPQQYQLQHQQLYSQQQQLQMHQQYQLQQLHQLQLRHEMQQQQMQQQEQMPRQHAASSIALAPPPGGVAVAAGGFPQHAPRDVGEATVGQAGSVGQAATTSAHGPQPRAPAGVVLAVPAIAGGHCVYSPNGAGGSAGLSPGPGDPGSRGVAVGQPTAQLHAPLPSSHNYAAFQTQPHVAWPLGSLTSSGGTSATGTGQCTLGPGSDAAPSGSPGPQVHHDAMSPGTAGSMSPYNSAMMSYFSGPGPSPTGAGAVAPSSGSSPAASIMPSTNMHTTTAATGLASGSPPPAAPNGMAPAQPSASPLPPDSPFLTMHHVQQPYSATVVPSYCLPYLSYAPPGVLPGGHVVRAGELSSAAEVVTGTASQSLDPSLFTLSGVAPPPYTAALLAQTLASVQLPDDTGYQPGARGAGSPARTPRSLATAAALAQGAPAVGATGAQPPPGGAAGLRTTGPGGTSPGAPAAPLAGRLNAAPESQVAVQQSYVAVLAGAAMSYRERDRESCWTQPQGLQRDAILEGDEEGA